ncbi:hypothetical protein GCM10027212_02890 [Actinotalea caeni]
MADGDWAVVTRDLRKTYRGRPAVDGLDLRVPARGVHGFLGPNGSGKTTTIRMLLGLVRADSGRMRIFGRSVPRSLPEVVDRVGAIVESPKFLPSFSGRRNLDLLAQAIDAPRGSVDDVLERTAMRERAGEPYRGYSLGMKQRLAIAATLLKNPDLLIFDEPSMSKAGWACSLILRGSRSRSKPRSRCASTPVAVRRTSSLPRRTVARRTTQNRSVR